MMSLVKWVSMVLVMTVLLFSATVVAENSRADNQVMANRNESVFAQSGQDKEGYTKEY